MKLNESNTKIMTVYRSGSIHPKSTPLTLNRTVPNESADLVILGVTFDAKMTFEKHLRSASRAAAQSVIMRMSWQVFHDRSHFLGYFLQFCPAFLRVLFSSVLPILTLNYWIEMSGVLVF